MLHLWRASVRAQHVMEHPLQPNIWVVWWNFRQKGGCGNTLALAFGILSNCSGTLSACIFAKTLPTTRWWNRWIRLLGVMAVKRSCRILVTTYTEISEEFIWIERLWLWQFAGSDPNCESSWTNWGLEFVAANELLPQKENRGSWFMVPSGNLT